MKKLLIFTWLPCLLAMFASASLVSCSDDDDDNEVSESSIIGTWVWEGEEREDGTLYGWEKIEYTFNEDGTARETESYKGYDENKGWGALEEYTCTYTYKLDGNKLYLTSTKDGATYIHEIKISGNKLYLTCIAETDANGNYEEMPEEERVTGCLTKK